MRPGGAGDFVGTFDVDLVDLLPVAVFHLVEGLVTQDASIVHQHIDPAEAVHGLLDDTRAVAHRVVVGDGTATGGADLFHHPVGGRGAGTFAVGGATQVVDHDLGTASGKQQCMGTAQAAASPGDDHHAILQTDRLAHAHGSRQVQVSRVSAANGGQTIKLTQAECRAITQGDGHGAAVRPIAGKPAPTGIAHDVKSMRSRWEPACRR
ncbi:hypothetical protein D9M71_255520 [compost metagenome]